MKKLLPFLQPALFLTFFVVGILLGSFTGGFMAGAGMMLLIFVTLGKLLFKKSERRMNAAMGMKAAMQREPTPNP